MFMHFGVKNFTVRNDWKKENFDSRMF
jgi:hypothetical protein